MIHLFNALWTKKRSQWNKMVSMEKNSKKLFSDKHYFLCIKPSWENLARINIFPTWGIVWVTDTESELLGSMLQNKNPPPLPWHFVFIMDWILLNSCPPFSNPWFIVFIEWNCCQCHLPLKMFNVSGAWKAFLWCFASAVS